MGNIILPWIDPWKTASLHPSLCTYSTLALTLSWSLPNLNYITGHVCGFKTSMSADVDCKPGKTTALGFNTGLALKWQATHNSSVTWFFLCCHNKVEWITTIPVCKRELGGWKNVDWDYLGTDYARFWKKFHLFSLLAQPSKKKKKNQPTERLFNQWIKKKGVRALEGKPHTPQMLIQYYYHKVSKIHGKYIKGMNVHWNAGSVDRWWQLLSQTYNTAHVTPQRPLLYTVRIARFTCPFEKRMTHGSTCWSTFEVQEKVNT